MFGVLLAEAALLAGAYDLYRGLIVANPHDSNLVVFGCIWLVVSAIVLSAEIDEAKKK